MLLDDIYIIVKHIKGKSIQFWMQGLIIFSNGFDVCGPKGIFAFGALVYHRV